MRIFKYLAKEVYTVLSVVAGILLLTFLSNAFVRYLTRAASGKLSGATVLKIMAIQIPTLLGLLLPVSLFLAILLAYGRMYVDSEMTVLTACGMSRAQLLKHSLIIAIIVIVLDIFLVFYISPMLTGYQQKLLSVSPQETLLQTIQPGRFQVANGGADVFYIQSLDHDRDKLENIFVAQKDKKKSTSGATVWNVLSASSGYAKMDDKTTDQYIVATDGYRYYGVPGQKAFKIIQFSEYGAKLSNAAKEISHQQESMTNAELWKLRKKDPRALAELQWRISVPLSIPLLVLLAVPLSRVRPRQGRYAQLLPAILIYAIYANMLFVAKDWVAHEKLPSYVGMWWLHGVLLIVALGYWAHVSNVLTRFKRERNK